MKYLINLSIAMMAIGAIACKKTTNEKVDFPIAESYSPGYVKTGDTVSVIGQFLCNSTILIGSEEVTIIKNTDNELQFIVTPELSNNPIKVVYATDDSHTFSTKLVVNYVIQEGDDWISEYGVGDILLGPKQLLVTDFDGAGIRVADETDRFDETQWVSQVQPTGTETITDNYLGISSDLGKGNYYALSLSETSQLGNYGHVGKLMNRLDLLNGNTGSWINNFTEYKGSPITKTNISELDDLYLNFAFFKNDSDKSLLRVDLQNASLGDSTAYRNEVSINKGIRNWEWISIPFTNFKNNWGNNSDHNVQDDEIYELLNQLQFAFTHKDEKNNTGTAEGEVHFLIDHIIITQGAPYPGQPD